MKVSRLLGIALLLLTCLRTELGAQQTVAERQFLKDIKTKAEKGDAEAQLALASFYATGNGVSQDLKTAARWHRKAAEQGLARAQLLLGFDYMNGYGVKVDKAEGFAWVRRAAESGLAEAQLHCGMCCSRGNGVAENAVEAARFFREAAEQGLARAEFELGECYFEGNGVAKDIAEGLKWARRAGEEGCAAAQNRLGLCYLKGEGLGKDYIEAYKWFNLAAAQGDERVYDIRVNLVKTEGFLTPEQIAEAQRLSREFKPRTGLSASAGEGGGRAANGVSTTAGSIQAGFVNVRAEDDSYDIFVDGAFVGNTPAKLKLPEGSHVIEVKKTGFANFRTEIKVNEGSELNLRANLKKL